MLALAVFALGGGAAATWADVPPAVEAHETAQAPDAPAESRADEEASWGEPGTGAPLATSTNARGVRGTSASRLNGPPTPPPK